jgi:enoyl-CoA hydratase/carnithine racemase
MSLVEYELSEHIAVIRFNRPDRLNAMSLEMRNELGAALKEFNGSDDAWVGIITGTGRSFCAGRDMKNQAEAIAQGDGKMKPLTYTSELNLFGLSDTDKPLIAAVNGFAIGLGWYMVLDCDIRVAATGAEFAMTEVPTGMLGPYWLAGAETLPWPLAAEFALIGERVKAERLLSLGLLNAVVAPDELMDEAYRWARKLAALPPMHVRRTKDLMRAMRTLPDTAMYARETAAREYLGPLEDSAEAVLAWSERRPAEYHGR